MYIVCVKRWAHIGILLGVSQLPCHDCTVCSHFNRKDGRWDNALDWLAILEWNQLPMTFSLLCVHLPAQSSKATQCLVWPAIPYFLPPAIIAEGRESTHNYGGGQEVGDSMPNYPMPGCRCGASCCNVMLDLPKIETCCIMHWFVVRGVGNQPKKVAQFVIRTY